MAIKNPLKSKGFCMEIMLGKSPSKTKALQRKIIDEVACPFWTTSLEDISHAIFTCPSMHDTYTTYPI